MKSKLLYSVVLFSILFLNYSYSQTYVPDDVFEQHLIDEGYDTVLDNYVSTANIANLNSLDLNGLNVTDLTGLKDFTALTVLDISSTLIVNLDVSSNTALTYLDANDTSITSLNLNNNINLNILYVDNTYLNSLNLSNNTALSILDISDTSILSLDVSNNTALTSLSISNTSIVNIDISNNTALTFLNVYNTILSSLDVSYNTSLTTLKSANTTNLYCITVADETEANAGLGIYTDWQKDSDCNYSEICNLTYVPDDNFEQYLIDQGFDSEPLDNYVPTANIKNRTTVDLSNLNVTDLTGIEDFKALEFLDVSNNNLNVLHVSTNTSLTDLNVSNTLISSLDVSYNDSLTYLNSLNTINLDCITVANAIDANSGTGIYINWEKDSSSSYSVNCNSVLSVIDFDASEVYVGPNPMKDELQITVNNSTVLQDVSIFDISGKLVLRSKSTNITTGQLKSGMYLIKVETDKGSFMRKLIKN